MTRILLIDNGSKRADAVLSLRSMARALTAQLGASVDPISLQHADQISAEALGGEPAVTLENYLINAVSSGERHFVLVPVFFGDSRALTSFVPDLFARLEDELGDIQWQLARPLYDVSETTPALLSILKDNIQSCDPDLRSHVVLVDHGSPAPVVTAVRSGLAKALAKNLDITVHEACMERRAGPEYDFNGETLDAFLANMGKRGEEQRVTVAMLFVSPGRHAGSQGDIDGICRAAEQNNPGLAVSVTPLVGEHPSIIDLLARRYHECVRDCSGQ